MHRVWGESLEARTLLATSTTLIDNGPGLNRIDIVFVGDGYTTAELGQFSADVQHILDDFFDSSPLSIYASLFNVHRVDVASSESGIDNDPDGVLRDTAMNMGFLSGGGQDLLVVDIDLARDYAALAPDFDQIFVVGNTATYGGSGDIEANVATVAGGNAFASQLALHEFGHSFGDLADEYDTGGSEIYTGTETTEANTSIHDEDEIASLMVKWWRWLDHPDVGAFEGADTHEQHIYRPTQNSIMRDLTADWGPVNTEQLVINAYRTVRPIESATDAGSYSENHTFEVDPVDLSGHSLTIQWLVDGQPIAGAGGTTFSPASLDLSGTHTLSVHVTDDTALVRDESARDQYMTDTRSWNFLALPSAPPIVMISGTNDDNEISITESGQQLTVLVDGVEQLYDLAGVLQIQVYGLDGDDRIEIVSQLTGPGIYAIGGNGDDTLIGGDGNDTLVGAANADVLIGGSGVNRLDGGKHADDIRGGGGNDRVYGGDGFDTLAGDDGADRIYGGEHDDVISGGDGNDTIYGEGGNDLVRGDAGNDYFFATAGHDTLRGGAGKDVIRAADSLADVIDGGDDKDYAQVDLLDNVTSIERSL